MFDNDFRSPYLDMAAAELSKLKPKKEKPGVGAQIKCCGCGRSNVTLRKTTDCRYICERCYELHLSRKRMLAYQELQKKQTKPVEE